MRSLPLLASVLSLGTAAAWGCGGSVTPAATSGSAASSGAGGSSTASTTVASFTSGPGGAGGMDAGPPAFCTGKTQLLYDPAKGQLDVFPDDYFTLDDPTSVTGLRVHMVLGDNLPKPAAGPTFNTVFQDISTLDGFGTTASLAVTFSGPLDVKSLPTNGDGSGKTSASVVLVNLDSAQPELVDFEWELVPETTGAAQTTLILSPMVALLPKTHYGLAVTTRTRDAAGACIAPTAPMQALLDGSASDPKFTRLGKQYTALLKALESAGTIKGPADLSGAVVFTTERTVDDSVTIAKEIRTKPIAYTSLGPCVDSMKGYSICEGSYPASDFRVAKRGLDEKNLAPQATYVLPVTTYLPTTGTAPFPTIIYGHGLGGDRHQAEALAALAAPKGYATVAIDAVKHGNHPDGPGPLGAAPSFFGLSFDLTDPLDSIALRDHFRQSTYDKLQLVELLRPGVDIDGDSKPDVGLDRFLYLGVSLGGIMSAEFTAFAPDLQLTVPIVPGARVTDIIKYGQTFAQVISLLAGSATNGQVARFFPIVQTVVDRGDAGAYTAAMVRQRLAGFDAQRPQALMQMVIKDDTVPNVSNLFFARGLGVPHVGDELLHIGTIPHQQKLPVSGNLDATHTGGVFQFDVVYVGNGPQTQPATHSDVAANPVAITQTLHFIDTYFSAGVSEIIDPYRTLGIKP